MRRILIGFCALMLAIPSVSQKIYSDFVVDLPASFNYIRTADHLILSKYSYRTYQVEKKSQFNVRATLMFGFHTILFYRSFSLCTGAKFHIYKSFSFKVFYPENNQIVGMYKSTIGPGVCVSFPLLVSVMFNRNGVTRPILEGGGSFYWNFLGEMEEESVKSSISDQSVFRGELYNMKSYFTGIIGVGIKRLQRSYILQYSIRLNGLPAGNVVSDFSIQYRVTLSSRKKRNDIYTNF